MFLLKPQAQKHANYAQISSLNKQSKICITGKKLHLILSDCSFMGRESIPIYVAQWNFPAFQYGIEFFPFQSGACKERHNLCMNHSFLDCASWNSISYIATINIFMIVLIFRKFKLYKNYLLKITVDWKTAKVWLCEWWNDYTITECRIMLKYIKVAVADMRYFARSKLSKSLVHRKKFSLIWEVVFKLVYLFC